MAAGWLADLSSSFKRHRVGRPGWHLQVHRDRLRLKSTELPPRPGETGNPTHRTLTLATPPGPSTVKAALDEACAVFDAVMAGSWSWPGPDAPAPEGSTDPLAPANLQRLIGSLREELVGERMQPGTWQRTWAPYLEALLAAAAAADGPREPAAALLARTMRRWPPNSRARQMGHDRARALWRHAGWPWPPVILAMRGNGRAAADPAGVRAFTDEEIALLRERITASKLTPADLVAWDCLIVFGLRPVELQGLELTTSGTTLLARVTRQKVSSKGAGGIRAIPAVPPSDWPADCYGLLERWQTHGLPPGTQVRRSPGELLTQQLRRLGMPRELSAYGLRHAFALRLGLELGLHVREAAELMGHSPAVHIAAYGRRLDAPNLLAKVVGLTQGRANS